MKPKTARQYFYPFCFAAYARAHVRVRVSARIDHPESWSGVVEQVTSEVLRPLAKGRKNVAAGRGDSRRTTASGRGRE